MVVCFPPHTNSYRSGISNIYSGLNMASDDNKERKIVYIRFNLWFPPNFKTKKCSDLILSSYIPTNLPFDMYFKTNEQSIDVLITSTVKDLIDNGYEELLNYQTTEFGLYKKEDFPDYKNNKQRYGK